MKVVLISAPYLDVYGSINVGRNHTFSLGVGYIASYLMRAGYEVSILDPEPLGMTDGDIRTYLRMKKPDLVGVSSATPNFKGAQKMGLFAKEETNALIIVGGVHASALPEEVLQRSPQFDLVVIGEGEETMLELCNTMKEGASGLEDIKGLMLRKDGAFYRTPPRPLIQELDNIPFPARDLINLDIYRPQVHLYRGRKSATMITSRGCPAKCTFCATEVTMGTRFRSHSPEYVVSEIEHLVNDHGVQDIIIVDDTFTINSSRVKKICRLMLEKNLDVGWFCFARVNNVSHELFSLMKEAGCFSVFFGVESGDEQVLKNIKKGATLEQSRNAMRIANQLGLKTMAGFMIGNPGDNHHTITKTIDFALELNPIIGSFNIMTPFPGTEEYYRNLEDNPSEMMNWDNYVPKGVTPLIRLENLSKTDLQRYISKAYIKFYLRPSQIYRIIKNLSSFAEFIVYLRGALGLFSRIREWIVASHKGDK
ncbi:MAG: radical SAM protein [Desulfobacterales bacterium]|nr:radical SAM protein [Desulfobacterales bacterium]